MFNFFQWLSKPQAEVDTKENETATECIVPQPVKPVRNEEEYLMRSFVEQSFDCISRTEDVPTSSPSNNEATDLLKTALSRIQQLDEETRKLYDIIERIAPKCEELGIGIHELKQTCQRCGYEFIKNGHDACSFHSGNLVPVTFEQLSNAIIDSFTPSSIKETAPEQFWVWDCCNRSKNEDNCCFDRHMPLTVDEEEEESFLRPLPRAPTARAFFHPTDSIFLYSSTSS